MHKPKTGLTSPFVKRPLSTCDKTVSPTVTIGNMAIDKEKKTLKGKKANRQYQLNKGHLTVGKVCNCICKLKTRILLKFIQSAIGEFCFYCKTHQKSLEFSCADKQKYMCIYVCMCAIRMLWMCFGYT